MPSVTRLSAFDFDGTLSWTDSFSLFLVYVAGRRGFARHMAELSPFLVAALAGGAARDRAKAKTCEAFFAGHRVAEIEAKGAAFARDILPLILRRDGMARIAAARKSGLRPVIVSASLAVYLGPWAREMGLDCAATELARDGPLFTGAIAGANCRGAEKLHRLRARFGAEADIVEAFGDSAGDREMLAAARHAHWRPFRDRPAGARRLLARKMHHVRNGRAGDHISV